MNQNPSDPTNPDAPWEEAMSRDFDARVRDLHEAPIDFTSVKGKAHKIRRNRRAAVAGGILGVAAIFTPIAVLTNGGGTSGKEPGFAPEVSETDPAPDAGPDYLVDRVWHQADGDTVELDQAYDSAVLWDGQLVATRFGGEVYSTADVIDADGDVVRSFSTTGSVVVNDAGTTIAWVDSDGAVMTAWDDEERSLGEVDLAAPGEASAWTAAAVTGGPDCNEEADGCIVYVNSNLGEESRSYSSQGVSDIVASGVTKVHDADSMGAVTVINDVTEFLDTCGGIYEVPNAEYRWETCDYQVHGSSPDGRYVVGLPSQFDGLGPREITILDAETGDPTAGRYAPEGRDAFIRAEVAWTDEGTLAFAAYDGARWHLMEMEPDGSITELATADGSDVDSPFVLIGH
ncbi:hypothetical protein [Nocardioides antri]|uniref:WD40 repeat domain-containing protein n=1 Tax=Nocardioides antri TaxID=2607659 RepID=A0A5B1M690_9ACTN|nr:hypothetical protein [Nocardioides antri]KAA1427307.1 hypothetical protein F0U47_07390 [Nocardioides antri]